MKRQIIYPGAIPLETDLLNTNQNVMVGLGKLVAAVMGTTTLVSGLACAPTAPASLNVSVGPGEIYSLQNLENTAYSSVAADTSHQIMKQGIRLDASNVSCPAPATAGYSINYLIQASFAEVDGNPVVLPYYNASNPAQAYSGPNNSGSTNSTIRDGTVVIAAKAGIAAATGTQVTPAPDAGYVGLWVVTVANGQTTIAAGNISQVTGAPFLNSSLLGLAPAFASIPTAPTPSQFANGLQLVNAAYVQRELGSFSGYSAISASRALTAADIGQALWFSAAGFTLTLPTPASLGIAGGKSVTVFGNAYTGSIAAGAGAFINFAGTNDGAISIKSGQTAEFMTVSSTTWQVVNSTAAMDKNADFVGSKANNGYQKLPGGLIIQWARGVSASAQGTQTITFPIAFTTAVLSCIVTDEYASPNQFGHFATVFNSATNSQIPVARNNQDNGNGVTPWIIAIGY